MKTRISVIGSDSGCTDNTLEIAEKIGEDIAKNDCILVCGGRRGVMNSACRGARRYNGITIGILPSLDKNEANDHVQIPLPTGMGHSRNSLVASCSDAVIAISGNTGTLSEIGLALSYKRPVVLVEGTGGVVDFFANSKENLRFGHRILVADKDNAVKKALEQVSD